MVGSSPCTEVRSLVLHCRVARPVVALRLAGRRLCRSSRRANGAAAVRGRWPRGAGAAAAAGARRTGPVETVPGMPPVLDPATSTASRRRAMSPAVAGALPRIYVPNRRSNDVYVIDPATLQGRRPLPGRHQSAARRAVMGSEDLVGGQQWPKAARRGSLTPIDPKTGKPRRCDHRSTIPTTCISRPTARRRSWSRKRCKRLDFRDPHTMALQAIAAGARLHGHQPRRFLDRRPLRDLHLRISRRRPGQDRHGRTARCWAT